MDVEARIERALERAVAPLERERCPGRLGRALRAAVFPGGGRVRPKLVLAVADACGAGGSPLADRAAAAIELLHCASLVQDDLPCFDDAPTRRGRPSVHGAHGERLAILASDALIVGAFDTLSDARAEECEARLALVSLFARRVGSRGGITAGQGWESEAEIDLEAYHRAKTGALFAAATEAGAIAAGALATASRWREVGERIGAAYQVADDLHDVLGNAEALGKPTRVDAEHDRPNAVAALGIDGATERLATLVGGIVEAVPECPNADRLTATICREATRFVSKGLAKGGAAVPPEGLAAVLDVVRPRPRAAEGAPAIAPSALGAV